MSFTDMGFCPRCGAELERCEPPGEHHRRCPSCGYVVYNNPAPVVVATVVDEDHALFVRRADPPEKDCWSMPGGYMELGESPIEGAARELAEETGLEVDPDDLKPVDTEYEPIDENRGVVSIIFAAPTSRARGDPAPGDDAAELRFWTRDEIAENPAELRAGDVEPILWAIDTVGKADAAPLW